jgi:hypothetical protein
MPPTLPAAPVPAEPVALFDLLVLVGFFAAVFDPLAPELALHAMQPSNANTKIRSARREVIE